MDEVCTPYICCWPQLTVDFSINIFVWSVSLCTHAACKSFGALFAVRFIMGICEGAITAGFLLVTSMFYTRKEQTVRVGYWCKWRVLNCFPWRYQFMATCSSISQSSWMEQQSSSSDLLPLGSYTLNRPTSILGSGSYIVIHVPGPPILTSVQQGWW